MLLRAKSNACRMQVSGRRTDGVVLLRVLSHYSVVVVGSTSLFILREELSRSTTRNVGMSISPGARTAGWMECNPTIITSDACGAHEDDVRYRDNN